MIVVTFALEEESRDFVPRLSRLGHSGITVVHTGVGQSRAQAALQALRHRPKLLVSAGFAGALDPNLAAGDVLVGLNFSDPDTVARYRWLWAKGPRPLIQGDLSSQFGAVESPQAKAALFQQTGALAVDMETAAIALWCAQAGVPLLSMRVISDTAQEGLPVPMAHWFDLESQRPRPIALLGYLASHPGRILPFARFVRGLGTARRALAARLWEVLGAAHSGADC